MTMRSLTLLPILGLLLPACNTSDEVTTDTDVTSSGLRIINKIEFVSPVEGQSISPGDPLLLRARIDGINYNPSLLDIELYVNDVPVENWSWLTPEELVWEGTVGSGENEAVIYLNVGEVNLLDEIRWIGNTAPEVDVQVNSNIISEGQLLEFYGVIQDEETPISELEITATLDGEVIDVEGNPETGGFFFTQGGLSAGMHYISLVVADEWEETTVNFEVEVVVGPDCASAEDTVFSLFMDESGGDVLMDSSPRQNEYAVVGPATWTLDPFGGSALDMAGGSYIDLANAPYPNIWSSDFTFSAWVNVHEMNWQENQTILQQLDGGGLGRTLVYLSPSCDGALTTYIGGQAICGQTALQPGMWHHVALVRDRFTNTVSLYLDGQLEARDYAYMEYTNGGYLIGAGKDGHSQYFNGSIDQVQLLSRPFTQAEVVEQFQAGDLICEAECASLPEEPSIWLKTDEWGGGTLVNDGYNGGTGAINGDFEWTYGTWDGALNFDGESTYVDLSSGVTPDFNYTDFTISMKVRFDGEGIEEYDRALVQLDEGRTLLYVDASCGGQLSSFLGGAELCGGPVQEDTWYHVALTYEHATQNLVLYLDGIARANGQRSWEMVSPELLLGVNRTLSTQFWKGPMDEVLFFDRALDEMEVMDIHAAGSAFCLP